MSSLATKGSDAARQHKRGELKYIAIELLRRGKYQPRQAFSVENLESLAKTIKQVGVLEPLVVRSVVESSYYEIIAGERRWRAAQLAGLDTVPCLINNYSDVQAAQIALIENTARESLNAIDEAKAIERIVSEFKYTHEEIGAFLGINRSTVTNLLRLLSLDYRVQELISQGALSEGHGRFLAGLPLEHQYKIANECLKKAWTTRALEKAIKVKKSKKQERNPVSKNTIYISRIERELSDKFSYPVNITLEKDNTGYISIHFADLDQMQGALEKLGYEQE